MLDIYRDCGKNLLAIPFITGQKTDKEKFAGAEETYTIEALMHDGKALQSGTTHYFGTGFAKHFNITFQDRDGVLKPVYQTSWGLSTRLIGAVIMVHGDDSGLVLPPYVAPVQAVIIPIMGHKPEIAEAAGNLRTALAAAGIRVKIDDSDKSPGWKFSEYEMKGVPVRIEIGPRDLAAGECVVAKRIDGVKLRVKLADIGPTVVGLMRSIHDEMYEKALANIAANLRPALTYDTFKDLIANQPGYVKMMWCGDVACENKVKEDTTATARCLPFDQTPIGPVCPVCGRPATKVVLFAKAY